MTAEHLTATVAVPISKYDPNAVKYEEIPLPPREMWEDGETAPQAEAPAPPSPAGTSQPGRPIEKLDFIGPTVTSVPLAFPFRHPALGLVEEIHVRRLTVGEVGAIMDRRSTDAPDLFDIYEVMTGVPASVLRGLEANDGDAMAGVCFDFLPRFLRGGRQE